MFNGSPTLRYYLFSLSNLIAAFGGGLILGKGASVIDLPYLQGGSILAFFIGTILGLAFLQFIPKKMSKLLAQSFSISCGITSLILCYIYYNFSYDSKLSGMTGIVFFLLLSIRFGFWFYSRVMRASTASSQQQSIAWVELGYYLGMVLGLIVWKLLGLNIALGTALIIDACFQFVAGILDFWSHMIIEVSNTYITADSQTSKEQELVQYSSEWCWKLASAVVLLSIGIQAVIFHLTHYVSAEFGSYILATFYLGVAMAAYICNKYKIYIMWNEENNLANIACVISKIRFNLSLLVLLSGLAVVLVISAIFLNQSILIIDKVYFVCISVFIAAFIYEIIAIAALDRLGYEEKKLQGSGMIMRTYGSMGLGAAISLWILGLADDPFKSSIITIGICLSFATIAILKRRFIESDVEKISDLS